MPRTSKGWLKVDALKTASVKEQYAVAVDGARIQVELWWHDERHKYVVLYKRVPDIGLTTGREWHFSDTALTAARNRFSDCVAEIDARKSSLT